MRSRSRLPDRLWRSPTQTSCRSANGWKGWVTRTSCAEATVWSAFAGELQAARPGKVHLAVGEGGRRVDFAGADGLHAGRNRLEKSATDMAAEERGLSATERRPASEEKSWDHTHFRAPQIARTMILSSHGSRFRSSSRRRRRPEGGADRRARAAPGSRGGTGGRASESVGRHGADRRAEAQDRQARASGLRAAVGALGAADRPAGARVRGAGGQRHGRRAGGGAGGRQDDDGAPLHSPPRRARHVPRPSAARARGDRSADGLRVLRRQSPAQARRGRDADAGDDAAAVEGDRDGAGEVLLPGLREDQPGAGAVPCRSRGDGRARACWR